MSAAEGRGAPRQSDYPAPPVAERRPFERALHGDARSDPYAWLRDDNYPDVQDPDVLAYLHAENAYTETVLGAYPGLREGLYDELKARLAEDDQSYPAWRDGYYYYHRTVAGYAHPVYCRRWGDPFDAPEEILLDVNERAAGRAFCRVVGLRVSPDQRRLAFFEDTSGNERFRLYVKELGEGTIRDTGIADAAGDLAWADDNETFLYTELDSRHRPRRARRASVAGGVEAGSVHDERDPGFFVHVERGRDGAYLHIECGDKVTTECRLLPAARPGEAPFLVLARRPHHYYAVFHHGDSFYVLTNDTHRNFRLASAPEADPQPAFWEEVIPPRDSVYLTEAMDFRDHLVIVEREGGLPRVRVMNADLTGDHKIYFPDEAFSVHLVDTGAFDTAVLRLHYESLLQPPTTYDYDMAHRRLKERKVQPIPSGYDRSRYRAERLHAPAFDGAQVPISIVYPKDFPRDGSGRLHLTVYGAYGLGFDPYFSLARLSLLERGFACAFAHVRGGDELGYGWYEAGKFLNKRNTFDDTVAAAEYLVAAGYTAPGRIALSGGSAGGMVVGAVVNQRSDLFHAAVAKVPFVDVLTTMLDASLPLTAIEWEEWGNPADPAYYDYIKSYCPYTNVRAQAYPHMLVTAGLADPRVTYWEPAKWVAALRAHKTDDNLVLLNTIMSGGHSGPSGRYARLWEVALEFAFLLIVFDLAPDEPALAAGQARS